MKIIVAQTHPKLSANIDLGLVTVRLQQSQIVTRIEVQDQGPNAGSDWSALVGRMGNTEQSENGRPDHGTYIPPRPHVPWFGLLVQISRCFLLRTSLMPPRMEFTTLTSQ